MKKFYSTICLALLITFAVPRQAEAGLINSLAKFIGGWAATKILDNIYNSATNDDSNYQQQNTDYQHGDLSYDAN